MNHDVRKHLIFDADLCTGCEACTDACALKHGSNGTPGISRIRFQSVADIDLAVICQHCEDPVPCQKACPQGAIGRNDIFNAITISKTQCIGCWECITACPFGAIYMDEENEKAYKCDLCREDPECVKHCDFEALTFGEATSDMEADYKALFEKVKSLQEKG